MPWLQPDDDVRRLQGVWVGNGGFRWPFEARFVMWGMATLLTPVFGLILWLAVPTSVLLAWAAWAAGWHRSKTPSGAAFSIGAVLLALLVLSPAQLVMPMPWYLALLLAPVAAILTTRRVGPYVRYETPLRYWLRVVWWELNTNRGQHKPRTVRIVTTPRG